jgi:hypothetical protein
MILVFILKILVALIIGILATLVGMKLNEKFWESDLRIKISDKFRKLSEVKSESFKKKLEKLDFLEFENESGYVFPFYGKIKNKRVLRIYENQCVFIDENHIIQEDNEEFYHIKERKEIKKLIKDLKYYYDNYDERILERKREMINNI